MQRHNAVMAIGRLAELAGVTAPTIRYYEDIGLLPAAARSRSGQRRYDGATVERLTFIRRCRDFGFSLDQVRQLADLTQTATSDCLGAKEIAATRLTEVRARLQDLAALERTLNQMIDDCDAGCANLPGSDCAVFAEMAVPLLRSAQRRAASAS